MGCGMLSMEEDPSFGAHLAGEVVKDVAALAVEDGDGLGKVMPLQEKTGAWSRQGAGRVLPHHHGQGGPYLHDGAF